MALCNVQAKEYGVGEFKKVKKQNEVKVNRVRD